MSSMFQTGDRVRSNVNAQGLVKDALYVVDDVAERRFVFGTLVTYTVHRLDGAPGEDANQLDVNNGHLLLRSEQ